MGARRSFKVAISLSLVLASLAPVVASAARRATVNAAAIVRQAPDESSAEVESLAPGTEITVSNFPTKGYYKVRTNQGRIGWLEQSVVVQRQAVRRMRVVRSSEDEALREEDYAAPDATGDPRGLVNRPASVWLIAVRGFGGMTLFPAQDQVALLGDQLKNGFHFGGELSLGVSRNFALTARVERVRKTHEEAVATASATMNRVELASTPVMGGIELFLTRTRKADFGFKFLGGMALSTTYDYTAGGGASQLFEATPVTYLLAATFAYRPRNAFGLYLEGGYRVLMGDLEPAVGNTDTSIYPFDMSGPVVSVGVSLGL